MARHVHEFQCTNCLYWNYPMLSDAMHGNYTLRCGNCKHEHYRVIKHGVVTEDRHNSALNHGDTIHIPKAASQKEKRQVGEMAEFRRTEMAGLVDVRGGMPSVGPRGG